ncbi:MAG: serine/threonine protein kinase, partial [Polyangiaceae bacterium]|nr:serine/threonine protein kinase [Polyangiaceae bacterium]
MASLEAERVRANLKSKLFGAGSGSIKVGRFELGAKIGSGGMGVVYRARDPELERDVAVKILRTEAKPERLLAEARAMARLEHPNVVGVYEAGTSDGRAFVAMELVRGQSLGVWLEERERSQEEILDVFRSAARGLDAAHRAGIVHRDFKPANVLVSAEGEARVADFGLAGDAPADDDAVSSRAPLSATRAAGTPFYMAPEVLDGARATAKSDQFAFGVSLYEALTGRRPFEAKSLAELRKAQATPPPTPRTVSRRLHKAIDRMLSRDPDARFESMAEVAEALAMPSNRSALAVGALLVASVTTALFFGLRSSRGAEVCSGSDGALADVWSDERKASTEKALVVTEAPFAAEATKRTVAALDAYAGRWRAAHRDACEAANVRKEQSPAVMDRRMACLQRRKSELDAFVKALAAAGPDVLERAADGVSHLTPVERCADVERLERESP